MEEAETKLVVAKEQLERARDLLHRNRCADIGLSVLRATLLAEGAGVSDLAAAIALNELDEYGHYPPEFLLKAVVQCRETIGEGGGANISAAIQELMVTFDLK
jgi:hypothetical protein